MPMLLGGTAFDFPTTVREKTRLSILFARFPSLFARLPILFGELPFLADGFAHLPGCQGIATTPRNHGQEQEGTAWKSIFITVIFNF